MTEEYQTREYWNARTRQYAGNDRSLFFESRTFDRMTERVRRQIAAIVRADDRTLDVCCGSGRFAGDVFQAGGDWDGVDFSEEMHKLWAQHAGRGTFFIGDARTPQDWIGSNVYDVILGVMPLRVLGWTDDQFRDVYRPYVTEDGIIACLDESRFTIYNYYG